MKRRGFTLVELLAVIAVLALLLILAVPMVMKARDNTIRGLNESQKKNIRYAGEMVGIDLDDYASGIYNCQEGSWIESKCTMANNSWTEVAVSLDDLKAQGYFEDYEGHCSGTVKITHKGRSGYDVDLTGITCG